jgi:hypothetical protein
MDLRDDDTWLVNARHDIDFDNGKLQSWSTTAYASFVDHKMDNLSKTSNREWLTLPPMPRRTIMAGGQKEFSNLAKTNFLRSRPED